MLGTRSTLVLVANDVIEFVISVISVMKHFNSKNLKKHTRRQQQVCRVHTVRWK